MDFVFKILNLVLPALFALLGVMISNNFISKNRKIEMAYKIYDKRLEAYQDLYSELVKLNDLLKKNMFRVDDHISVLDLFCINHLDNIEHSFISKKIFFSSNCIEHFEKLLECIRDELVLVPLLVGDKLNKNEITGGLLKANYLINKCLLVIKKDLGLDIIEKELYK